jgi:glyoxylase-like metal-dependent hydrolase (beta-lactamase superfamily II)
MSESQTEQTPRAPVLPDRAPVEVAPRVHVLTDDRIDLVPNVGIVVGDETALVVDTAMGVRNGERVLARTRELGDSDLVLTITHFHPEHGWGAQAFEGAARLVYNRLQLEELHEKFAPFVELFSSFGPHVAEQLEGVRLVEPDETYEGRRSLDLGGITAELIEVPAHTRGDQVIWLPKERVLFTGDLVETRFFPILPDEDAHGSRWIEVLRELEALAPQVVVPGHGEVGGVELIAATRQYLEAVRERVRQAHERGEDPKALADGIRHDWPDWDNPIWIDFAVDRFDAELPD